MLNVMKRNALRILSAFIISTTLIGSVSAHPGRTDSSGGHTNHSTGEYHYHHGYSAHDHYDMDGDGVIDCPYDFDDQTDHSNHGYSSAEKDDEWDAVPYEDIKDRVEQYGEPVRTEKGFFYKLKTKPGNTILVLLGCVFISYMMSSFITVFIGAAIEALFKKDIGDKANDIVLVAIWIVLISVSIFSSF